MANLSASAAGQYRCIIANDSTPLVGPLTTVSVVRDPLRFETIPDALQITDGIVRLRLTGLAGTGPLTIYASTNLLDWEQVLTHAPTVGTLDFTDSTAANHSSRYCRATEGP
jgi:hypothetical protein